MMEMKYTILTRTFLLILVLGVVIMHSCEDKWDEHYSGSPSEGPDQTMMEYINSQSDLSTFSSMLKSTGYDTILNTSQSYTVWAPVNDGLEGLDLTDEVLVRNTVDNHITRSRITTSGITSNSIRMFSDKYVFFSADGAGYVFGGSRLTEPNQPVYNGLAHKIERYSPYTNNIWEYIETEENVDSVRQYLLSKDEIVFDPVNSIEIGYNDSLQPIYDSVFIYQNTVLNILGDLNNEDSTYTTILPDNNAWTEAYDRISGYFNIPEVFGGEQRQKEITKFTIIQDMVFRGRIEEDQTMDSLVSTYGNVFYNPSYLFDGAEKNNASNGYVYQTTQMPFVDTTSWFKEISVEAENTSTRDDKNANVFLRTSYGSGLDVSNDRYILVTPLSTTSKPSSTFYIANTLSATYNIYCVFVPESIVDETKLLKSKVSFVLTYLNTTSGRTRRLTLKSDDFVIQETGLTKMFLTEFDFEFANVIDEENETIAVRLEVINEVKDSEASVVDPEFTRNMRIDAIILEPVTD